MSQMNPQKYSLLYCTLISTTISGRSIPLTCNLGLIEGPSSGLEDSLFDKSQSIKYTENNTSSSPPSGRKISLDINIMIIIHRHGLGKKE